MATPGYELDALRAWFPAWSIFRSNTGAFYGTRRGVRLGDAEVDAGLQQTVSADDMETFIARLMKQDRLKVRS